jgi:glycosyltransferase involved in cell wall biosynthesis
MLVGTPVVAYSSGALPEVIGDSGLLVEEGDVDGLARAIDRMLGIGPEAAMLAATAQDDAQRRFGAEPLSRRVLGFWERVLSL